MNFKEKLNEIKAFIFDVDGVLSASCVPLDNEGELVRMLNVKDGYALNLATKLGYPVAIISGGKSEAVRKCLEFLGVQKIYLCAYDKKVEFNEFLTNNNLQADQVLYMGDDIPDYEVMKMSGLATAPLDAAPEIKEIAHYVSDKKGGEGCVRDVIEQTLKAHGNWMTKEAFTW